MSALPNTSPIHPVARPRPFDHSDYLFELKYDGFRAMAYFQGGTCDLVSRNKHVFGGFKELRAWLVENLRVRDARTRTTANAKVGGKCSTRLWDTTMLPM
jgi:hypothetical protein